MFFIIMFIIYIICLLVELREVRRNRINIFNEDNLILFLCTPATFPYAIYVLFWVFNYIKENYIMVSTDFDFFYGYYLPFALGAIIYIIYYIKRIIYFFIEDENKVKDYANQTIYSKKNLKY